MSTPDLQEPPNAPAARAPSAVGWTALGPGPGPRLEGDPVYLLRATVLFAVAGASLGLAIGQLAIRQLVALVISNQLSPPGRTILLASLAAGAALGLLVCGLLHATASAETAVQRVWRMSRFAAPLVLAGALPPLLTLYAWTDELKLAVSLSVFVLALEPLFRLHFSSYPRGGLARLALRLTRAATPLHLPVLEPRTARRLGAAAISAMAAAYIGYMVFFTLRNHHRFNTFTWDLGQIDNQFFNFLHGHPFRCPALIREGNWSELRNHAEVVMVFLLPFYALHPAAETLLVLQAVLLGLAGISVYRFAARRLPRSVALALAGCYYLYPPLHGAQFFDIHFQPVAAAFMLAAIDFFDGSHNRWFALFFGLAILSREDISVGTAVFGLFLMVTGHRPRAGAIIFGISAAYFVAIRFFIMPAFGTWGFAEHYRLLFADGERTFASVIKTIITNPVYTFSTLLTGEKLRYLLQITLPLAFLPMRRLYLAMSLLPGAFFTLLTTEVGPPISIGYQYGGYFIPYIFPAAALALARITAPGPESRSGPQLEADDTEPSRVRRRAAIWAMVAATVLATIHWGAIPPRRTFRSAYGVVSFEPPTPGMLARLKGIEELAAMVPRDAILAVSDREMPHVSNRVECWNISVGFAGSDYILYDSINPIPPDLSQVQAAIAAGYARVAERSGLVLLRKPPAPSGR